MTESFASKHGMAAKNLSDSIFVEHAATIVSQYWMRYLLCIHNSA